MVLVLVTMNDELALALGIDMKFKNIKSALKSLSNKSIATSAHPERVTRQEEALYSKSKLKNQNY